MAQRLAPPPPPLPAQPYYIECDVDHKYAHATDLLKPLDPDGNEIDGQGYHVVLKWPRIGVQFTIWKPESEALMLWSATACRFRAVFDPVSGATSYTPDMAWVGREAAKQAYRRQRAHRAQENRRRRAREEYESRRQRAASDSHPGSSRPGTVDTRSITGYTPQSYHRTGPFRPPSSRSRSPRYR